MLIATLLASAAVWAVVTARVIREPGNHVAVEPLLAIVPFVLLLVIAWLPRYRERLTLRTVVTAFALLSVVSVVALDRANVLVQYDRWYRRGMPGRPCGSIVRHIWSCNP
jgi:hypothetical protein